MMLTLLFDVRRMTQILDHAHLPAARLTTSHIKTLRCATTSEDLEQLDHQNDETDHEQQVNQSPTDMETETEQPEDYQDKGDGPQHIDRLLNRTNDRLNRSMCPRSNIAAKRHFNASSDRKTRHQSFRRWRVFPVG